MLNNQLEKDIKKLENMIRYRKLYNIRNNVMSILIKSGITLDYALPFIISFVITLNVQAKDGNMPFHKDNIVKKASVYTIDTSSGIHLEYSSFDDDYKKKQIEYSTGWSVNKYGLYERTITSYRIDDKIDLNDTDKLFSMSKDEIQKLLVITNIKKVQKSELMDDDYIYNDDALIIINHYKSDTNTITRLETTSENAILSIFYIAWVISFGNSFRIVKKFFFKNYIKDKLNNCLSFTSPISADELNNMNKILELKKANLELINASCVSDEDLAKYQKGLRKDKTLILEKR